jgi:hypothetical protein
MRHTFVIPVLAAVLSLPASAQLIITGRVTVAGSNTPVEGASVYANDLALSNFTLPDGSFQLTVPASLTNTQVTNLRVRAVGFAPGLQAVALTPGKVTVNFTIVRDTANVRERTIAEVAATTRAGYGGNTVTKAQGSITKTAAGTPMPSRAAYTVPGMREGSTRFTTSSVAQAAAIEIAADPFNRLLFQPDQVMRYQDALRLSDDQRGKIQTAMEEAQKRAIQVQWGLAAENEKFQKILEKPSVEEKEVIAQMDRIVGVEREMKRAQLELLVKIKNTLTEDQQKRLRELRGYDN